MPFAALGNSPNCQQTENLDVESQIVQDQTAETGEDCRLKRCAFLIFKWMTFMAFWRRGSFLWRGTEEGVEIRGDEVTSQVEFCLQSFTWDPQSTTKRPVILTAIYKVNTFQGFLGSPSAALASVSNTKSVFLG